jgi:hypothetical protein
MITGSQQNTYKKRLDKNKPAAEHAEKPIFYLAEETAK